MSVQVLQKSGKQNVLLKTIGSSKDEMEIAHLYTQAEHYIAQKCGQLPLSIPDSSVTGWFQQAFSQIGKLSLVGTEMILGKLYDQVGFHQVEGELFRDLVLSRLVYPSSKLKTLRYLEEVKGVSHSIKTVYRYMDKLHSHQRGLVSQISYTHTIEKVLGQAPTVLFYDVTTIYFEAEKEDEWRIAGFSKEGKHRHPQILLGLLVSAGGYPMAYEVFEGNKYEGHTMLPVLAAFKEQFSLERLVVIADSGLMNKENIEGLGSQGYEFIIGARIKNETGVLKAQILANKPQEGLPSQFDKGDGLKLVVSYSAKRAKKDQANRERGLDRLRKAIKSGKLTKAQVNNRGYNKFLKLTGQIKISLDEDKLTQDQDWDGLKGYLTNIKSPSETLISQYGQLWEIEKAFRVSKTELRVRPIYHRLRNRIEAHICISFAAYKLFKELERLLKKANSKITVHRALEVIPQITAITILHPNGIDSRQKIIYHTEAQRQAFEEILEIVGDPKS